MFHRLRVSLLLKFDRLLPVNSPEDTCLESLFLILLLRITKLNETIKVTEDEPITEEGSH